MDETNFDFEKFCRGSGVEEAENFDFEEFCRDGGTRAAQPNPEILPKDIKIVCSKIRGFLLNLIRVSPQISSPECENAVLDHLKHIDDGVQRLISNVQRQQLRNHRRGH